MKIEDGGVLFARDFLATGINVGIKNNTKKDMALVYSKRPCALAGTFTTNRVKAAPVMWDHKVVNESEFGQTIIINSGVANACTGKEGLDDCEKLAKAVSSELNIPYDSVLVASTGVIGARLPMEKMTAAVPELAKKLGGTKEDGELAATAIMTTDTVMKQVACSFMIGEREVHMGGMCKGAGMIHPNMATMLCFITTDCDIDDKLMKEALKEIIPDTFNMISVDGDTSTNDTVLVLANGAAGNEKIVSKGADYDEFYKALKYINEALAKKIAGDGEGATCLFEVVVKGASDKAKAKVLAKSVVTSSLTKAAIFGHDANWGRILCALGYSGADFDPEKVDIYFKSSAGFLQIVENGVATGYSEEEATKILSQKEVSAIVDMKEGDYEATAWGCDLTFDYVKINADYRS
jgi:glutamate N-acetyltransferase/amino-acid N-acetyltransferase